MLVRRKNFSVSLVNPTVFFRRQTVLQADRGLELGSLPYGTCVGYATTTDTAEQEPGALIRNQQSATASSGLKCQRATAA